ncbi:15-hydroxyprostaglandin dehydrogenase [NAD(+)] isoform X1 [Rhizophagus clarus]|uniref:15-hydroxyprostaglandin dehydrogenase [NAD(+)] isoform X1 n=1 Tax=Rhizophagus clarus TaxID=94130 RepID=A0A8H3L8H2_9GLOM|nr:15-hydroxyprostaglandin dehydrogenase [NAD(+)] isoform X1 [Rhizophagus clarus]
MSFTSVEGKVAFISGAASGIGKAIVTRLVKEGAKVTIADVQDDLGKKFAEELNSGKTDQVAIYEHVDVANWNEYLTAFKKTVQIFGRIDIVVNNAGIFADGGCMFDDSEEPPHALRIIDVNLKGVLNGTKLGIKFLKQNGKDGGVIVNTSSISGLYVSPHVPYYSASKFGVIGLSISVAETSPPLNIRVNVVAPGAVNTPLMKDIAHTIPGSQWLDINQVVDEFFKFFTNPAYNGEISVIIKSESTFLDKSNFAVPTIMMKDFEQVKFAEGVENSNK